MKYTTDMIFLVNMRTSYRTTFYGYSAAGNNVLCPTEVPYWFEIIYYEIIKFVILFIKAK